MHHTSLTIIQLTWNGSTRQITSHKHGRNALILNGLFQFHRFGPIRWSFDWVSLTFIIILCFFWFCYCSWALISASIRWENKLITRIICLKSKIDWNGVAYKHILCVHFHVNFLNFLLHNLSIQLYDKRKTKNTKSELLYDFEKRMVSWTWKWTFSPFCFSIH